MKDFDEEEEKLKKKMAEMDEEKEKLQRKLQAMNEQKEKLEKIMEDDDGVLEDEEEEEVKERFSKTEFNNDEEDRKVMSSKSKRELSDTNNKIIFAAICLLIVIAIGAIILVMTKSSRDSKKDNDSNTPESGEKSDDKKNKRTYYGVNGGTILYDDYIYHEGVITDLLGEEVSKIEDTFDVEVGKDFFYEYNGKAARESNQKVIIKKLVNKQWKSVLEKDFAGVNFDYVGVLVNPGFTFLGIYNNSSTNGKVYLLDGDTHKEITLSGMGIYKNSKTASSSKFVYDNQYIMTFDKRYNSTAVASDNDLIGLYDIKNNREMIKPTYDEMSYVDEGRFLVKKDGKAFLVDQSGKVLLDNKYTELEKRGDYFVALKDDNLVVLNAKYKEIEGAKLKDVTSFVTKSFKGNLIVGIENGSKVQYYYLDSSNHLTELVNGSLKVAGNYLVTQEFNSSIATFYNKSMKVTKKYDLGVSIDNWNLYFFFEGYFILTQDNGTIRFYDHENGKQSHAIQKFYRTHNKEYYVEFLITDGNRGIVTIKKDDKVIGKLDDATFENYLSTANNGISFRDNMIFYYATGNNRNDVLVIKEK